MATGALPRCNILMANLPVPGSTQEPSIDPTDAEELCNAEYASRREALRVARRLRAAGWVVVEHPDGLPMVASVYHPNTYDSPGDVIHCHR
jgi:hypothetical protein